MKTIYSATKPTGKLTLGNYLGAIKNWKKMQEENNCIFAVADLHSLTIDIDSKNDTRKSTNKLPDKEQDRKIICSVGQLVADAEIWIPEEELIKYYIAHKSKFEKRFEKEQSFQKDGCNFTAVFFMPQSVYKMFRHKKCVSEL